MTNRKKAAVVAVLALVVAGVLALVCIGCSPAGVPDQPETKTLVSTSTMRITAEGRNTTVSDLAGGSEYGFTTRFVRKGQGSGCRTTADTSTVRITIRGADLEVTDKTAGKIYTIHRGR